MNIKNKCYKIYPVCLNRSINKRRTGKTGVSGILKQRHSDSVIVFLSFRQREGDKVGGERGRKRKRKSKGSQRRPKRGNRQRGIDKRQTKRRKKAR